MIPMRHRYLECTDKNKINDFLCRTKIGYLGISAGLHPYVIPLNYVWWEEKLYFHASESGRKIDVIKQNPTACFTVSEEYGTISNPVPAKTDTAYFSVMIFGKVEAITAPEQATLVLQKLLDKYVPGYYSSPLAQQHVEKYRSSMGNAVSVFQIIPETITAKENPLDEEMKFYPGRSQLSDANRA
ncbi:pyridoxamine 5'-phosphate oxidase family protein [Aneurinibacillus tyrosinisolvens]|uniref:pyridoxamine 5'-phosphate oxidase family protein n=1 Tax=Aneurinibacillus tyrosinisolvens TaxID=1443435 RepID=UPI00063F9A38|nr:pyridoxamine 5'-phosphate oxidase family protein [Aneurinibacillus tyrosinisolvens]